MPGAANRRQEWLTRPPAGWHRVLPVLGSTCCSRNSRYDGTIQALQQIPGIAVVAFSSLYQSAAWGAVSAQPDYINAVAQLTRRLTQESLLTATMRRAGSRARARHERNAARTIDIDIPVLRQSGHRLGQG